jgi:hypothetical protein
VTASLDEVPQVRNVVQIGSASSTSPTLIDAICPS